MTPPMLGTLDGVVLDARPFSIHGDAYLELSLRTDAGDGVFRVPAHAYRSPPAAGQRVRVTFLMGQVTGVESA